MAIRKIIKIDEDLCNGCGECVPSCAEGAIQIIDGVAKLVGDNLCDGLGACLGDCPEGALSIIEKDADEFDKDEVRKHMDKLNKEKTQIEDTAWNDTSGVHDHGSACGCPSARVMSFDKKDVISGPGMDVSGLDKSGLSGQVSHLMQWPVQLHLLPPEAPYFKNADVLLCADCVAFAVGDFHERFLKNKAVAIACPKLDNGIETYVEKLTSMIDKSNINTLTVLVMEVPCCSGLLQIAKQAVAKADRKIPVKQIVISLQGQVLSDSWV